MPPIAKTQLLYLKAKESLGIDLVSDPSIDPSVSCAASVNEVFRLTFGRQIGGGASTALMYQVLKNDPHFKQATGYSKGYIVISPTGTSTKGAPHGHVGICGVYGIMSNNSMNGLWQEYYTEQSWHEYYVTRLGFPMYYFEPI